MDFVPTFYAGCPVIHTLYQQYAFCNQLTKHIYLHVQLGVYILYIFVLF